VNTQVRPVPDRSRTGGQVGPRHQPMTCPVLPPPYREDRSVSAPGGPAAAAAEELLRTALIAKLAVDLDDPALARRAANEAAGHARLLVDLDLPVVLDVDVHADVIAPGSTLDELLRLAYPAASRLDDADDQAEPDDELADDDDGGAAA
jgi:hypothetical protein